MSRVIAALVAAWMFMYLIVAFVLWDVNASAWSELARVSCVFLGIMASAIVMAFAPEIRRQG